MKITFLGTRGYLNIATAAHQRHTTTLISYRNTRILIDWGEDWLKLPFPKPLDALFITHAHPDHAGGLLYGAPCPVYASKASWRTMKKYAIKKRHIISLGTTITIKHLRITPFSVIHSLRAPAVGYRISAGRATIFYVPDLIAIKKRSAALQDITLYIGDGATIDHPLVRRSPEGKLFGHTTIKTQLGWCKKEKVPQAIFTHCGSQIVGGTPQKITKQISTIAQERGIPTTIATDGLEVILR